MTVQLGQIANATIKPIKLSAAAITASSGLTYDLPRPSGARISKASLVQIPGNRNNIITTLNLKCWIAMTSTVTTSNQVHQGP
jgi:hypothetical protein